MFTHLKIKLKTPRPKSSYLATIGKITRKHYFEGMMKVPK